MLACQEVAQGMVSAIHTLSFRDLTTRLKVDCNSGVGVPDSQVGYEADNRRALSGIEEEL